MPSRKTSATVQMGFEETSQLVAMADIQPLRVVTAAMKKSPKYAQIAASIREVGIIEPPVVARIRGESNKYLHP